MSNETQVKSYPGMGAITLVEVIRSDPRFAELWKRLSLFQRGSVEFYKELYDNMPLYTGVEEGLLGVPVPGSEQKGHSPVFRNSLVPEGRLLTAIDEGVDTGYHVFKLSARMYPNNHCLGTRVYDEATGKWLEEYRWETYSEVEQRARNLGAGLLSVVNVKRSKPLNTNDFIVALMSVNNKEWVLTDLACQTFSMVNTALYDTLGPSTSEYIMNLTEAPVVVLSKANLLKMFALASKLPALNTIVIMDDMDAQEVERLSSLLPVTKNSHGETISVLTLRQVERIGQLNNIAPIPPTPESIYTISFTSGTTSLPKGVELTQRAYASALAFACSYVRCERDKQKYALCFLPLTHIYQRQMTGLSLMHSFGIGFLHKPDPEVLLEDMRVLKPTMISLVPRVLTKLEAGIKNSIQGDEISALGRTIASKVLDAKHRRFSTVSGPDDSYVNRFVYRKLFVDKVRDKLGFTNVPLITTGSAPIAPETLMFIQSALDLGILQGYGLTETFGGNFLCVPYETDCGSCGPPAMTTEVRLRNVPGMSYDAEKDHKGEVLVRSQQLFEKYYKMPKKTAEVLDKDGWFATGDVGYVDKKGRLYITDRVKNIFKLSQGEYIAPEKVENCYLSSCPFINQVYIHGNSLHNFVVAVVGLDLAAFKTILDHRTPKYVKLTTEELVSAINKDPALKRLTLQIINSYATDLQGFEKIGNIYVDVEPLSVDAGTMTPTFKVKREVCGKVFKDVIDQLYAEGHILKAGKL
ncbi:AaceriADR052Wp [[Ashbya] aceris (nom. inval.)]|nr:AaceriADR052Wp [[Ashbya] aceris (nom. inval.)]